MNWWRVKVSGGCPLAAPRGRRRQRQSDGQSSSRQGVPARQVALRAGRGHDDPDREDDRLRDPPALPLRRRVHRPVPLRAAALLVSDADLAASPSASAPRACRQPTSSRLFGALDRLGGFFVLASIREFAPFVTAVVVAGVAGTAITADLGARKIREELDALQVLGVDPIKNLVVPRFLALMLITGLLDIYALIFGITGGDRRRAPLQPAARRLLRHPLQQRLGHRPLGLGRQDAPCSGRSSPSSAPTRG